MSEHTRLPWRVRHYPDSLRKSQVFGPPHKDGSDYAPLLEADEGNAEFIVRACNSHEQLVDACVGLYNTGGTEGEARNKAIASAENILIELGAIE